jgi:hypothetical protein
MSAKERNKIHVIRLLMAKEITVAEASAWNCYP